MTDFEKKIGYEFKDKSLLLRALTHSSYANEKGTGLDNERLEFLGDSVLGFITAEYLFEHYKNKQEGELTKKRAYAVCEKTLFGYAEKIDLGDMILLGKGEEHTGGRQRPSVVSDAFEAVIAAIYLDGGIEEAKNFDIQVFLALMAIVHEDGLSEILDTSDLEKTLLNLAEDEYLEML